MTCINNTIPRVEGFNGLRRRCAVGNKRLPLWRKPRIHEGVAFVAIDSLQLLLCDVFVGLVNFLPHRS